MESAKKWWSSLTAGANGAATEAAPASESDGSWLLITLSSDGKANASGAAASPSASASTSASGSSAELDSFASDLKLGDCFELDYKQRIAGFVVCSLSGCLMLFMSCFYISKVVVGSPQKFALTYSLANMLLLGSVTFLVGPLAQLRSMCAPNRVWASAFYWSAMLATLYSAWRIRYAFVVLPCLVLQFAALLWYVASYVPFGHGALSRMFKLGFRGTLLPI